MKSQQDAHVCYTTSGLDLLPRKLQRDELAVAQVLADRGRFSAFEASATPSLARTMERLARRNWFHFDRSCAYPWTGVTLTPAGRKALGMAKPETDE